jgi:hypothetical protein
VEERAWLCFSEADGHNVACGNMLLALRKELDKRTLYLFWAVLVVVALMLGGCVHRVPSSGNLNNWVPDAPKTDPYAASEVVP